MQILESEHDAGGVEDGSRLGEDVCVDVHHEVATSRVLHHEAHVVLSMNKFSLVPKHLTVKALTSVWKQEKRLTRKGCLWALATSKMRFSARRDSTSSLAMMSPFFSALIAKYSPVLRYCDKITWNHKIKLAGKGIIFQFLLFCLYFDSFYWK